MSDVHIPTRPTRADQILDAARSLFAEAGYEATSVAGIARRVGVADGAIYRHFASKREILQRVILSFYEPLVESATRAVKNTTDPRGRLQILVHHNLSAYAQDPLVCRLIIAEARVLAGYYESTVADLSRQYTSLAVDAVNDGIAVGVFRSDVSATAVRDMIFGAMEHMAWASLTGHGDLDIDGSTATIMTLIVDGITARPTHQPTGDSVFDVQLERLETIISRLELSGDGQ